MFVLAVNGSYETYTPRFESPTHGVRAGQPVEGAGAGGSESPVALHPSAAALLHAYGRAQDGPLQRQAALVAKDIMQAPVICVRPDVPLHEVRALMKDNGFRHVPVVSGRKVLIGIVSDRDLLRYANVLDRGEVAPIPESIGKIMTSKVLVAMETTEIREVTQVMVHEGISAMPIINDSKQPVGILTVTDILRAIVNRAPLELWS